MTRLYISNSRGRQQLLPSSKTSRLKEHKDTTYQEKPKKKKKGGAKYSATTQTKARRKQIAARIASDDESTTSGIESADEAEAADDDDDTPEVVAPSRAFIPLETGRYQYDRSDDNLSEADDSDSMFGGSFNPDDEVELNNRLMDDNDDAYQAVDDISDSEIDDEQILEEQAKILLAEGASELGHEDSEDPSFYLNQIEGMSAYGFGDESDMPFSSQASESGNETLTRHVRFEETFPEQQAFRGFSESPTMSRALLPSALPDTLMHSLTRESGDDDETSENDDDEDDDSDLTDEDLPDEATVGGGVSVPEEEIPIPSSVSKTCRLPPLGKFFDDGIQPAGILDKSGSKLIITNPQSLGEEFARRYGTSAPASPSMGFAEAVLGTTTNSPETPNDRVPDPMLSGLNSHAFTSAGGQAVGAPEAFYPPVDLSDAGFDSFAYFPDEGSVSSGVSQTENKIKIEDLVSFDTDSDDEHTAGVPTSPMFDFDSLQSPGLSHIKNGNIMSFRRDTDPAFRSMHSSPITHAAAARAAKTNRSKRVRETRKRKATNDSPYSDMYYKGVTPVQRVGRSNSDLSMAASSPLKRQRLI